MIALFLTGKNYSRFVFGSLEITVLANLRGLFVGEILWQVLRADFLGFVGLAGLKLVAATPKVVG